MRPVPHRVWRPGDVDVGEQVQAAQPRARFGLDPWWTGAVVVARINDRALQVCIEEQPPDTSTDRLGERGIFSGNLLTGDRSYVLRRERAPGASGIDAGLLGDPDRTEVRGKFPRQRRLPGRFRSGHNDAGDVKFSHLVVGATIERRHSTNPMTASTRNAA